MAGLANLPTTTAPPRQRPARPTVPATSGGVPVDSVTAVGGWNTGGATGSSGSMAPARKPLTGSRPSGLQPEGQYRPSSGASSYGDSYATTSPVSSTGIISAPSTADQRPPTTTKPTPLPTTPAPNPGAKGKTGLEPEPLPAGYGNPAPMPNTGAPPKNTGNVSTSSGANFSGLGGWNKYNMVYNPGSVSGPNPANQYQAGQLGQFDPSQAYQAGQTPGMDPNAQYQAGQIADPNAAAIYQAGQLPGEALPTYNTSNFSQYNAPDQSTTQQASNQALQNALANPESMSPEVVSMLKEKQKEQVLAMQNQMRQQYGQSAASRGTTGGGDLNMLNRQLNDASIGQITQGQRQIDTTAASTNFNDRLNTIAAANSAMTGEQNRAGQNYGLSLQGQQAQAGENYQGYGSQAAATQYGLQQALEQQGLQQAQASSYGQMNQQQLAAAAQNEANRQAQAASTGQFNQQQLAAAAQTEANRQAQSGQAFQWQQADIDKQLAQQGLLQQQAQSGQAWDQAKLQSQLANEELKQAGAASGLSANQLALQGALGEGGLNLDTQRFNEANRQFNQSYGLDYQKFLDSSAQWRGQLGFSYAELDQKMKQWLAGSLK